MIGKSPAVDVAQMVEHDAAGFAEAGRYFEELDQFLRRESAGKGLLGRLWNQGPFIGGLKAWFRASSVRQ